MAINATYSSAPLQTIPQQPDSSIPVLQPFQIPYPFADASPQQNPPPETQSLTSSQYVMYLPQYSAQSPIIYTDATQTTEKIQALMKKLDLEDRKKIVAEMRKDLIRELARSIPPDERINIIPVLENENSTIEKKASEDKIYTFIDGYREKVSKAGGNAKKLRKLDLSLANYINTIMQNDRFRFAPLTFRGYDVLLKDERCINILPKIKANLKAKFLVDNFDSIKAMRWISDYNLFEFLSKAVDWPKFTQAEKELSLMKVEPFTLFSMKFIAFLINSRPADKKMEPITVLKAVLSFHINLNTDNFKKFLTGLFDAKKGNSISETLTYLALVSFNDTNMNNMLASFMTNERLSFFKEKTKDYANWYAMKERPYAMFTGPLYYFTELYYT